MTGILNALIAGVSGAVKDTYFNLVSLLLPGNGTNGAQNNTFLDGSSNNFTITRNGNTTQGTFSPFSQTGWGNYFNGSNAYINTGTSADFAFGTGDFQIEFFFFPQSSTSQRLVFFSVTDQNQITCDTNYNTVYYDGTNLRTIGTANANAWNHVVVAKSSGTVSCWLNGSRTVNALTDSSNTTSNRGVFLGANNTGTERLTGYMSNVSIVKGAPTYSGATITVPTAPLSPSKTNQVLLVFQANRFIDSNTATTAKTLTINGTPQITPFSPFAPTQSYSAAAVGGSGYFDGTGDYLNTASNSAFNFSATDCTIEFWYYGTPSTSGLPLEWGTGATNDLQVYFASSSTITFGLSGVAKTAFAFQQNAWNYIAAVKTGTTYYIYINGNRNTAASSGTASSSQTINIGARSGGSEAILGYLSNLRISNTARYTGTTMTVPTSPNGNDANTVLLLNFTNAGITDATAKNVLETAGNAQISTTQSKWGGSSIYFDGTGDAVTFKSLSVPPLGSGQFTIEFWVYAPTIGTNNAIFDYTNADGFDGLLCRQNANNSLLLYDRKAAATLVTTANNSLVANTWQYIAITRNASNTVTVYINGVSSGTPGSSTTNFVATGFVLGGAYNNFSVWSGYIQDFRVTVGLARTTVTTVPTAPFPKQ